MVKLHGHARSARRKVPALARWLLGLGIAATLAANVAHGLGHGPVGATVGAWPAVALVGSYELLMMIICGAQSLKVSSEVPAAADTPAPAKPTDLLHARTVEEFADDLTAGRTPSIRAIRARPHVGQPRAQQVRAHLVATVGIR